MCRGFSVAILASGATPAFAQTYQTIHFPGSAETSANAINAGGQIVGSYQTSAGATHGFLPSNGHFSTVIFPGQPNDVLMRINDDDVMVGHYTVPKRPFATKDVGFVDNHGTFTTGRSAVALSIVI